MHEGLMPELVLNVYEMKWALENIINKKAERDVEIPRGLFKFENRIYSKH